MTRPHIRPIAICIIRKENQILVGEHYDVVDDEVFYRPLGGGIEYGEYSRETLVRELQEELGAELRVLDYLGTIENIFTFEDRLGHEIVQVYEAEFVDPTFYEPPILTGVENNGETFKVVWKSLDFFRSAESPPLYPDFLLDLIDRE